MAFTKTLFFLVLGCKDVTNLTNDNKEDSALNGDTAACRGRAVKTGRIFCVKTVQSFSKHIWTHFFKCHHLVCNLQLNGMLKAFSFRQAKQFAVLHEKCFVKLLSSLLWLNFPITLASIIHLHKPQTHSGCIRLSFSEPVVPYRTVLRIRPAR